MKTLRLLALILAAAPAAFAKQGNHDCVALSAAVSSGEWICVAASGLSATKTVVFRSQKDWTKFWTENAPGQMIPSVNFEREMIVGAVPADGGLSSFKFIKTEKTSDDAVALRNVTAVELGLVEAPSAGVVQAGQRVAGVLRGVVLKDGVNDGTTAARSRELGAFDGIHSVSPVAFVVVGGQEPQQPRCTPGVDCPKPVQPKQPQQPQQPRCTPGVDCPKPPQQPQQPQQPRCTPGVDCPRQPQQPRCTPGVDCNGGGGGGGGSTPLPPNYRPRPSAPPTTFPPIGNPGRIGGSPDVAGYWHTAQNVYGRVYEDVGGWSRSTGSSYIGRGGREVGTQSTAYTATLTSQASRNVDRLYWRYVGYDCDPNNSNDCLDWRIQYGWFHERTENGKTTAINIEVSFKDDKELLPWEKERIDLSYDGGQVGVDARSNGAFIYSVRGPIVDQQTGKAYIELTPGAKVLRQPEADKVTMRLEKKNGGLVLLIDDARDAFYNGEPLEIVVAIKKDSGHWYSRDKIVYETTSNGPLRVTVQAGKHPQAVQNVPVDGSGKYYIKNWSFRRAQSQISSNVWIGRGEGNSVQY